MRDEFPPTTKTASATRVGWRCSNPDCRAPTVGPGTDTGATVKVGEACHIRAAAPGGPRFDLSQSPEERGGIDNAIWLCRICAKLIDSDEARFTVQVLEGWRTDSEDLSAHELGRPLDAAAAIRESVRFSLIRVDSARSAWEPAWRFRQAPVRFGFHQLPERAFEQKAVSLQTHSLDPILDITLANGGERPILVHRVGFVPCWIWSDLKGIPQAFKVNVLDCYELTVATLEQDVAQGLDLPDPVHVDPGAHLRFQLHLLGYRGALRGNESVIRLLVDSDVGTHASKMMYMGVY